MKKLHKVLALLCVSAVAASAGAFAACGETTPKHNHNDYLSYVTDGYEKHHGECSEDEYITAQEDHDWGTDNKCTKCGQAKKVAVTSVAITGADTVNVGQKITLTAAVTPDNATLKTVTWAIAEGGDYAEIDASTGELTAKAVGTVKVTATADGVSGEKTVTVSAEANLELAQTYAVLENGYDESGEKDDIRTVEIEITYTGTKALTATLSDPEIADAEVSSDKSKVTLTAKKTGKATLTVTDGEKTQEVVVEVATYGLEYGVQTKTTGEGDDAVEYKCIAVSDSDRRTDSNVYIPAFYWDVDEEAYLPVTDLSGGKQSSSGGFEGQGAFQGKNNVVTVYLGDNTETVGGNAFRSCGELTTVVAGPALRVIDGYAFDAAAKLTTIDLTEAANLKTIMRCAFSASGLTSIELPASCDFIGDSAFSGCANLTSVKILGAVSEFYGMTFCKCNSLKEIWIPSSVTKIDNTAFYLVDADWAEIDITEATTVHFGGTRAEWEVFYGKVKDSANTFFNSHNKALTVICTDDAQ